MRNRSKPGFELSKLEKNQSNHAQKLAKKVSRTAMGLGITTLTYVAGITGITTAQGEFKNPIELADNVIDFTRTKFGVNFCPPGPSEQRSQELLDLIQHPPMKKLSEAQQEAEAKGLHFVDPTDTLLKIKQASSPKDITDIVNNHTQKHYGIEFDFNSNDAYFAQTGAGQSYQAIAQEFVFYTSIIPTEIIGSMNTEHIKVTSDMSNGGQYNYFQKEMQIKPTELADVRIFIHEGLGHGIHHTACEGFTDNDYAFTDLNPEGFSYVGEAWKTIDQSNDPKHIESMNHVVNDYSMNNNSEDYAEIITYFLSWEGKDYSFYPEEPETSKLAIALDRIDQAAPGSAHYFASIRYGLQNYITYSYFEDAYEPITANYAVDMNYSYGAPMDPMVDKIPPDFETPYYPDKGE